MCLLKIPIPYKNSIENFIKKNLAEQMFRHNINIILLVCLLLL